MTKFLKRILKIKSPSGFEKQWKHFQKKYTKPLLKKMKGKRIK